MLVHNQKTTQRNNPEDHYLDIIWSVIDAAVSVTQAGTFRVHVK
jgi:hypothetical protein